MFQYQPFIMSGLGLEYMQELLLVESIHYRYCNQSGTRTTIQHSRINYHSFNSLRPILKNWLLLHETHMLFFLDALEDIIPQMKRSLFVIMKFRKQLQKGGKLDVVVLDKST